MDTVGPPGVATVGRTRELALLERDLQLALHGRKRVRFLTGEPGIGKTRLLQALATEAAAASTPTLWGGAFEAEGMPPYLPFLEALGQHVRSAPEAALRAQAGILAPVLATLLPELGVRLGSDTRTYALPLEQARLRLFEAVARFLEAIAEPHGLVLILDDLQWADPATFDLLAYLGRDSFLQRVLIAAAYRSDEVTHESALQRASTELTRLRILETSTLGPLDEAEIALLGRRYLGAPLEPPTAQRLAQASEGNPFLAEELLRGWLDAGGLARTEEGWRETAPASLPPTIVAAVRRRVARLDATILECLRVAAIIGRRFDVELLAAVVGRDRDQLEADLLAAAVVNLVADDGPGRFHFVHDTVRECLYHDLGPTRRRRVHAAIGSVLEARSGSAERRISDLAFHFIRSGDRERGATYAEQAAAEAMRNFAPLEALGQLRGALELVDEHDPRRGRLLLALGDAALLADDEAAAAAGFQSAQAWYEQQRDPVAVGRAAYRLGQAFWRQEQLVPARVALEHAVAVIGDRPAPEAVQARIELASLLGVSLHEYRSALPHATMALELAEQLEDEHLIAAANRTFGNLLVRSGALSEGIDYLERSLDMAVRVDDPVEVVECCAHLVFAYFSRAAMTRAHQIARMRLVYAQRSHDPYQLRHAFTWLAVLAAVRTDWTEAARLLDEAQAHAERLASPEPLAYVRWVRGTVAYHRGDYAQAEAELRAATSVFRELGPGALVWYLGSLALTLATNGKRGEAVDCLSELENVFERLPEAPVLRHVYVVETALRLGDRALADRVYAHLVGAEGEFHDFLVDRLLGTIELLRGDLEAARRHLAAAEACARREQIATELARTLEAQAELALAERQRQTAQGLLEQAIAAAERLGNRAEVARLHARFRSLRVADSDSSPLPAGLSAREAQVLRLVAVGRSNREIAADLALSEKTIENHLTSIYGKIGASGRAAASAYAIRVGLA
jgi:predicted ATPase/DNA-binding CsgD family transcriptional regulator